MNPPNTFHGYPIRSRSEPLKPGTPEYAKLTEAILGWREAAFQPAQSHKQQCLNAARELEIERDLGLNVEINKRIVTKL